AAEGGKAPRQAAAEGGKAPRQAAAEGGKAPRQAAAEGGEATRQAAAERGAFPPARRIERPAAADRIFHWLTAVSVLVLLATAFLPILGVQFAWVAPHWIAGFVMIGAILFHIVRVPLSARQSLRAVWIGARDLRD